MKKLLLLSILLVCGSCAHYHFGTSLPEKYQKIAVAPVVNYSNEPRLESLLRNSLSESLVQTPGVTLASAGQEGLLLVTRIKSLDHQRRVGARLREREFRDRSGTAYQTVVFQVTVRVEYEAIASDSETPYRIGEVEVSADYPMMADQETGRGEAFREAMRSAAQKIVAEVTEG
ncbi:MAG: hypothetical protein IKO65_03095 [Victivallales bacterium]|jgi:hypothetical protein|nr:hypothetical protein [Victivallales bacterium]